MSGLKEAYDKAKRQQQKINRQSLLWKIIPIAISIIALIVAILKK